MHRLEPPFSLLSRPLEGHAGFVLEVFRGEQRLSRAAFFRALRDEPALRTVLTEGLLGLGLAAIAWETAPVSVESAERPMEQLALPHPALARAEADPLPFSEHIASGAGTGEVRWFTNFGADAKLIVPCAPTPGPGGLRQSGYGHLLSFLRAAPPAQRDGLWRVVGELACEHLASSAAPLWVSTAGMAVSWVHVRLDLRPKYYRTEAFRAPTS